MINYLQHITKQNLWFRSQNQNMVALSCDEGFIKFNRKVMVT